MSVRGAACGGVLILAVAGCGESALESRSQPVAAGGPVTVGTAGNEPLIAVAADGTLYIAALHYLYRSTDGGASWVRLPGPEIMATVIASDSAIAFDPGGRVYFTFDYPYVGTTAVCTSDDRGDSWFCNPAVVPGGTDRMWVVAPSDDAAYVVSNLGLYQTAFLASADRGLTWVVTKFANGLLAPQTGPLLQRPGSREVLQATKLSRYSFYSYAVDNGAAVLSDTRPVGLRNPYALPSAAFDAAGTLFTASESVSGSVVVARSADEARSWTLLPPVPHTLKGTAVFSWVAAGAPGHAGVIYYHTPDNVDPNAEGGAVWSAWWAETFDAGAAEPSWTATLLEAGVHTGRVCIAVGCDGNARFAGDFISATIDAHGTAHLSWMRRRGTATEVRYTRIR